MADTQIKDTVVEEVVRKYQERSTVGILKYGTTLDRTDLSLDNWLQHVQEELMDATLYIERLRRELKQKEKDNILMNSNSP
jgi:hypothetical protein